MKTLSHHIFTHADKIPASLLFTRLRNHSSLSFSFYVRCSDASTILPALPWTLSSMSMPFLCCPNSPDIIRAECPQGHIAGLYPTSSLSAFQGPFHQCRFPAHQAPASAQSYSSPAAAFGITLGETSQSSCQSVYPAREVPLNGSTAHTCSSNLCQQPHLFCSTVFLKEHFFPSPMSLRVTSSNTGLRTKPSGAPLGTGLQPEFMSPTMTLQTRQSRPFLVNLTVNIPSLCFICLSVRMS